MFSRRPHPFAIIALAAAAMIGCGDDGGGGEPPGYEDCSGDRCESVADRAELLSAIEGFEDPISAYLRDAVRDDGTIAGDYRDVLEGLLAQGDCAPSSEKSFIVLSNQTFVPRSILTHCSDSPQEASKLFVLLPEPNFEHDEIPRVIHMSAWDDNAGVYRRFATLPRGDEGMDVNVEPTFCLDCHGGPQQLGLWMPLMNEMTNPWSQWNAEPGFRSHLFDEHVPSGAKDLISYEQVSAEALLDSASNFEPIIRSAIDRVTGARAQRRRSAATVQESLELLRPMFCDEGINYVSEIHGGGEIRSSALVDDAMRALFEAADVGAGLDYLQETTVRFDPPAVDSETLRLVPVRGEATLRMELALVTRRVLSPEQALALRALDWHHPVDSPTRCSLYLEGRARIDAGALDEDIAALLEQSPDADNAELMPLLFAELMAIGEGPDRRSLLDALVDDSVYDLPALSSDELAALATSGELQASARSFDAFAQEVQSYLDAAQRAELLDDRVERACKAEAIYPIAPRSLDWDCGS